MKNRQKLKSVNIILVIILIYSLCTVGYVLYVRNNLNEETHRYLTEVAKQGSKIIKTQVEGDFETLQAIANCIGSNEKFDLDYSIEVLKKEVEKNSFKRMGIILPSGEAILTDGMVADFSDRDYFKKAMQGETNISGRLVDKVDGKSINVYGTPIYDNRNNVSAVLFATHDTEIFKELLEVSTFDGEGYSYIVEKDGGLIIVPRYLKGNEPVNNIFPLLLAAKMDRGYDVESMREAMSQGKSGEVIYTYNNEKKYLNYEPVGSGEWYIASIIPEQVISNRVDIIINTTLLAAVFTIVIFGSLLFFILLMQRKNKKNLEDMAFIDPLTGAYNWNKFRIICKELLQRSHNKKYAYILLDVDKFKVINDLFGYEKGNKLLEHIMNVLSESIGYEEVCTRITADSYAMLITYKKDEEIIARIKIIEEFINTNEMYQIILSFGIYKIEDENLEVSIMSDRANLAKQTIKQRTDITYAFYTDEIRNKLLVEKKIEDEMEKALASKEFQLYIQPKYSFLEEKIVGAEALVRWSHPENGLMMPDRFIPIFERNGFIKKLDMYMYEEVCNMLERYKEIFQAEDLITISVNLAKINLSDIALVENLAQIAAKYSVNINNIEIELTESSLFNNMNEIILVMKNLKDKGFKIAIDDFGSGYSSLNILKEMPVDILKIDKVFLDESMDNERGRDIIESVIHMAKKLELTVVAEGVETIEQVKVLRGMGCDIAQGYYYARPMPVNDFIKLISE